MRRYQDTLETLAGQGRMRACHNLDTGLREGVVNFSSNDYLGLSQDERLKEAAIEAIQRYGTGSGASRLISGTRNPVVALEESLADFKRTEAALVFNTGYQANLSVLQAVLSPGDRVFCDRLNHASLVDGAQLSGARWTRYRHLDLEDLEKRLKKAPADTLKWIITDSVFSMDGDFGDLSALCDVAERYGAAVMVDEAHATGIYGEHRSSGLCEAQDVSGRVALQMGTFSKALGGFGAYVAGSETLIRYLVNRARGFIYSTALPPAVIGAAHAAIELVRNDLAPKARLWKNVRCFETCLQRAGLLQSPLQSPIVPVLIGDEAETMRISAQLSEAGYFVQGIRPPTVPSGTARLRITLTAAHTPAQMDGLAATLERLVDPSKQVR